MSHQSTEMADVRDISSRMTTVAIEGGRTEVAATSNDITSWALKTEGMFGFDAHHELNVKQSIIKAEKAKDSSWQASAFAKFSISSKPAVRGQYIATGTDDPDAKQHFLAIVDGELLLNDITKPPIVAYLPSDQHFADVKWLDSTTLIAATGQGNLKLFQFDAEKKALKHVGDMSKAAGSYIREVAVNPYQPNQIAIGGYDFHLQLIDLNQPTTPYMQRINMSAVIGSVKWAPFQNGNFVSMTHDEGKFFLFDVRTAIKKAAYYQHTRTLDLFCHERYNEYNVLFGYGDGSIKHIDMRKPDQILHSEQDPYVDAVGQIEYNAESEAIVVSGYTDFSVYRVRNGEAKIWSHAEGGPDSRRGKGWACAAAWYDANTTVSGDNAGTLAVHLQGFA